MCAQARKRINTRAFVRLLTTYLDSRLVYLYECTYLSIAIHI